MSSKWQLSVLRNLVARFPHKANDIRLGAFMLSTPMLGWIKPRIMEVSDQQTQIVVPLTTRTKNGWGTMFFAAIASGVDLCGGWRAFAVAEKEGLGVLYKSVEISFLRRCDGDVTFITRNNMQVIEACQEAAQSGKRINLPVQIDGYCLGTHNDVEPVVTAHAVLSIKKF